MCELRSAPVVGARSHILTGWRVKIIGRVATTRSGANAPEPFCAKGIVDAHGGRMWVESREGEGTTFFFVLGGAVPGGAVSPAEAMRARTGAAAGVGAAVIPVGASPFSHDTALRA